MLNYFKTNFKGLFFNTIVFFFIIFVFLNQIHQRLNHSLYYFEQVGSENNYIKKDNSYAKKKFSDELISDQEYNELNRECEITGDFVDRHKVRWVKSVFLKNFFVISNFISEKLPYYSNILLHSILIFLSFLILRKTFSFKEKYIFLFLVYITFIFQNLLSEYSYSIFELFFFSLALYASKFKKFLLFVFSCTLAVLNRESGFIIILSWLLFNKDYRKLIITFCISGFVFIILNLDIINCLINPKFFVPLENQKGQTDIHDITSIGVISFIKLLFVNFFLPFGLAFYFILKCKIKNKILIFMLLIYLLVFLIATPLHHISLRLIILPLIFNAIYFYQESNIEKVKRF